MILQVSRVDANFIMIDYTFRISFVHGTVYCNKFLGVQIRAKVINSDTFL